MQNAAYGAGTATGVDVDRLRRTLAGGGLIALARGKNGAPLGSGLVTKPIGGVAEIAAVGVLEEARRQGVGAAVTAFLADNALRRGIDMPFLMAAHEAEKRMYHQIGFVPFTTMLHMVREGVAKEPTSREPT